jgi:hypothetical protein
MRLAHKEIAPVKAVLDLRFENGLWNYVIDMPSLNRSVKMKIEKTFPYRIMGWEDTYPGLDGKPLTTTAIYNKTISSDYWRQHSNADRALREQLGLPKEYQ